MKSYFKECDVCLTLKAVRYKFYDDLQFLPVPMY